MYIHTCVCVCVHINTHTHTVCLSTIVNLVSSSCRRFYLTVLHCSHLTNLLNLCLINPLLITILIKLDKKRLFFCAQPLLIYTNTIPGSGCYATSRLWGSLCLFILTFLVFSSFLPSDHQKLEREARICRLLKHPNIGNYLNWKADVSFKEQ